MNTKQFPVIDPIATGKNIIRLRVERGMSVRDLQAYFGFEEPQAIYKWQQGKSLPSVDNDPKMIEGSIATRIRGNKTAAINGISHFAEDFPASIAAP